MPWLSIYPAGFASLDECGQCPFSFVLAGERTDPKVTKAQFTIEFQTMFLSVFLSQSGLASRLSPLDCSLLLNLKSDVLGLRAGIALFDVNNMKFAFIVLPNFDVERCPSLRMEGPIRKRPSERLKNFVQFGIRRME